MTFKEFTRALKESPRAMELLDRCDPTCEPLTQQETEELLQLSFEAADRAKKRE